MTPFLRARVAVLALLLPAWCPAQQAPPPPAPASGPALSPAMEDALHNLKAEDFSTREAAVGQLQQAFASQLAGLLRSGDPEVQSRLQELLEFQNGLLRWSLDLLAAPRERRQALLDLGLRPDLLPLMAKLHAGQPRLRREALQTLARVEGPLITDLIAARVADLDRTVYVAAMEALWDRPPTEASVDALWQRAIAAGVAMYQPQVAQRAQTVTFRGQALGAESVSDNTIYRQSQDHAVACDVLVHLQAPEVVARLKQMLAEIEASYTAAGRNAWMYSGTQEPMKNFARLMRAYMPPETIPALYRIATGRLVQRSQGQINGNKYFWSNRTWAIALLYEMTDRNPEDAKLVKQAVMSGMWTTAGEAEEEAIIRDLKTWWTAHSEKYVTKSTTRPQ